MGHEISGFVNVSANLLTWDQTPCLSRSVSLPVCVYLFRLSPADLCISLHCLCLWAPFGEAQRGVHSEVRGGSPAQSHLGRNRAQRHQKPLLSYTWGAPAMGGGYAALHANRCQEPSQKHLCLINMKGAWTLLCKHVLKTDFVSACCIFRVCPCAWEHRDDIPWHFMRSMCHKADIKVDIQLTWR